MAELVKTWNDGGTLTVTYDGSSEGSAVFSSDTAEGLDREMNVSFVDKNRSVFIERTVRQEGLREVFMASDGDFLLADGGTFNVLKPLPYNQVLSIASVNADAYIDTGFMPNNRTRLVIDYQGEDRSDVAVYVFGVGVRDTSQLFSLEVPTSSTKYTLDWAKTSTATSASIGVRNVIDLNKNVITIGNVSNTVTDAEFQCTSNLRLLSGTDTSGAERFSNGIIYSCQIYDDDVLIRDYIPVTCNGEAGLWDKLANKFYPSAGSGKFIAAPFPTGVVPVTYIESTGEQYIDTGIEPSYKTRVIIDMQALTTGSTTCFVGSREEHTMQSENQFVLLQTPSAPLRSDYFGGTNITISNVDMTQRTIIDKSANKVHINGSTYSHAAVTSGLGQWPLYVFGLNDLGTPYVLSSMRLYSCKIYDDGILVRDYYPVIREGVYGLYDTVRGTFVRSASGVDFTGK